MLRFRRSDPYKSADVPGWMEPLEQRLLLAVSDVAPPWDPSVTEPWESVLVPPEAADGEKGGLLSVQGVGSKRLLYIRATFADKPSVEPQTAADATSMLASVAQYLAQNSWGTLTIAATVTDLVVLPQTEAWYLSAGYLRLLDDARAAAAAVNPAWNWLDYDLDIVRYNGGPGSFLGQAYVGARGLWLKTSQPGIAAHELLHNLGLYHANFWQPSEPHTVVGPGTSVEYGDVFDIMGTASLQHPVNTRYKQLLGWLPSSGVAVASSTGLYRITAHDTGGPFDPAAAYSLRIPLGTAPDYWLDFVQSPALASNPYLANGVLLRMPPSAQSNSITALLDTTPATPDGRLDSAVVFGRTFSDPTAGVHITPLRRLDTTPPSVEVHIHIGNAEGNRAPAASLAASAAAVAVNVPVSFTVAASDPDGDALAFWWDFGDRSVGANEPSAVHSFAAPGTYRVRVVVSDMKGKTASTSLLVNVGEPSGALYRISGRVLDSSGAPLADVCVHNSLTATDSAYRAAWTDGDGRYVLTNVPPGTYTLAAARAGWSVLPAGFSGQVSVGPGLPDLDFIAEQRLYLVSGTVTADGATPLAGALVATAGAAEPTGTTGAYRMYLPAGRYTINVSKDGYTFQPAALCLRYGEVVRDFTAVGYRIAGVITGVANNVPITVTDGVRSVTVTGYGGIAAWQLPSVPAGVWHITASAAGYSFNPVGWANPLAVGAAAGSINFIAGPADRWTVRGTVTHLGEALSGVTISAGALSAVTDTGGGFALCGLSAGTWTITPSAPGRTFVPSSLTVTVGGADVTGIAFSTADVDAPPRITSPPAAVVSGRGANLSVAATDDRGAEYLAWTWTVVASPPGANVSFNRNGCNSASAARAIFSRAGTYTLRATARDVRGGVAMADVTVNAQAAPAALTISPAGAVLIAGQSLLFAAQAMDQFGQPMASNPATTWSVSGGGAIDAAGLFTASPAGAGLHTVIAACAGAMGVATFTVEYPAGPGTGITRQWWMGIAGSAVSALTADPRFPGAPDGEEIISAAGAVFEAPAGFGDNYGARMCGYFIAPTTGSYTFHIAADESAELWLSTDSNPANRVRIASVGASTSPRQWDKYASQQSAPVQLQAGGRYYIEALHKEAAGADHLAVGVTLPGGIVERPIPCHRLLPLGIITVSGTAAGETIELAVDAADPATIRITAGNTPTWGLYMPAVRSLTVNAGAGDDLVVVRSAPGAVFPSEGILIAGGAGCDTLLVVGTPGPDFFRNEGDELAVAGLSLRWDDVEHLRIDGGDGDDTLLIAAAPAPAPLFRGGGGRNTLRISGGIYEPDASWAAEMENLALEASGTATVRLSGRWRFSTMRIADTARVSMPPGSAQIPRAGLVTITEEGALDVGTGGLMVEDPAADPAVLLARITELISTARNGSPSRWQGPGITSSAAPADPLRGVAAIINSRGGIPLYDTWAGQSVGPDSILVAYTLNGDTDLNGIIDAADYFRIDQGYLNGGRAWADGDINYSGQVDADDYYLIDAAFLGQPPAGAAVPLVYMCALEPTTAALPQWSAAMQPADGLSQEPARRRDADDGLFADTAPLL